MPGRAVSCVLAGPGFDAAAHVLAHVPVSASAPPLVRAASLHDARYVAWCAGAMDERATEAATRDGPLLGALLERAADGHLLQALLDLHTEAEGHHAGAARELDASDGAPWAVGALRALAADHPELVAIARCAVGLVARRYAAAWQTRLRLELEAVRAALEDHLGVVAASMPSLRRTLVALSHPLGARGRVLPGRVVVGAPVGWADVDPARAAAIAVHEHAVAVAAEHAVAVAAEHEGAGSTPGWRWAFVEALALASVPRVLPPGPVAEAHRRHVASLDTSALEPAAPALVEQLVARLAA